MEIKKATLKDIKSIVEFQVKMAFETENIILDMQTVTKGVKAVFKDPSVGAYYVAADKSKVVGSLLITFEWSDWRNGFIWWIQSVYVLPEYRQIGVYSKMYKYIKYLVESDENVHGLRLYVENSNDIAQKAYLKLGMNSEHYSMFEWMK